MSIAPEAIETLFTRANGEFAFARWGRPIAPTYGAICILQPLTRDQASSGHIGFLHAMDAKNVWLLSGNSKNQVRISAYPRKKLIHNAPYRWPI